MAYADDLVTIRDNLATELKNETAQRLADQAAGRGVKTTYSVGNRSVQWNEYVSMMRQAIADLNKDIAASGKWEVRTRAVSR